MHYYYNVYFAKSIFYNMGIMPNQLTKELMPVHRVPILKKLGLLENYSRHMMHTQKIHYVLAF